MESKIVNFSKQLQNGEHEFYQGDKGKFFKFQIEFANGDKGQIMSTKENPSWKINESYTYNKKVSDKGYISFNGLKPVQQYQEASNKKSPYMAIQSAYNSAIAYTLNKKDILLLSKQEVEFGLSQVVNTFLNFINEKEKDESSVRMTAIKIAVEAMKIFQFELKTSADIIKYAESIEKEILALNK